jgi:beta-galactosidase
MLRQADRIFSSKQSRFLVTETDAQSIGGSDLNLPPYPGQLKQAAFAFISRGAAMIEYWHWHTLPYGTETYWGGVIPHSLEPGRVYRELSGVGADLAAIGDALDGYEPDGDVAILWSNDSRFAFEFFPPLATPDGRPDRASYQRIVDAFHRGVIDAGAQARILHVGQAQAIGAAELAARFPVLVAAALYVASDADLDLLRDYAAAGGHLVIGIRTGYADEEARARVAVAPDRLHEAAGVRYEEYSNLAEEVAVATEPQLAASDSASARLWADGLIADGAEVLARYEHPWFSSFPAVTTNPHGSGRITMVGTVPSAGLAADLVRWAVAEPVADALLPGRELPVTVASGTIGDGRRAWFVFNWSWNETTVTLARDVTDPVSAASHAAGTELPLAAWSSLTLIDG